MTRYSWTLALIAGLFVGVTAGCEDRNEAHDTSGNAANQGAADPHAAQPGTDAGAAVGNAASNAAHETGAAANTASRKVSDGWISFKVASALYSDTRYEGDKLDVDTQGGVVTLKGTARTQAGKDAATQIAQAIEGVARVDNQLSVVSEERKDVVDEKDEAIKERVDNLLDKDPAYKDYDVNQEITAGKVTLKGEVPDPRVAYQIVSAVRAIPGVKMVDSSQLTLKTQD